MECVRFLLPLLLFGVISCTERPTREPPLASYAQITAMDHPVASGVVQGADLGPDNISMGTRVSAEEALAGFFRPRADLEKYQLPPTIDWSVDPFNDANWRFQLHALRSIDPLIDQYTKDQTKPWLEKALDVALQWLAAHPDAPTSEPYNKDRSMVWQDMATGLRSMRLAYLHQEVMRGSLLATDDQLQRLEQGLQLHAEVLSREDFFDWGNHGILVGHGLMAICRQIADAPHCDQYRAYARDRMAALVMDQFHDDGGHREHSPSYHHFALSTFERVLETGWYQLDGAPSERMEKARSVLGWLADAHGRFPNIGDSERKKNPGAMVALPPQDDCDTNNADKEVGCYGFRHLPSTGYTILRTAPNVPSQARTSVFLTCARHSTKHKHQDELSFEWIEDGAYVIVDGGKYIYNNVPLRHHLLSRAAHSTVQMANRRLDHRLTGACTEKAGFADGQYITSGSKQLNRQLTHRREITYELNGSLFVEDTIDQSGKASAFSLRWLFGPEFSLSEDDKGNWILLRDGLAFRQFRTDPQCQWQLLRGADEQNPKAGFYSERYAELQRISVLEGQCPADAITVLSDFVHP